MKKEQLPGYAVALAVLIVGLVAAGVPLASFLIVPLVLACPLMMIFMMRGMGSMDHSSHDSARDQRRDGRRPVRLAPTRNDLTVSSHLTRRQLLVGSGSAA